MNELTKNLTGLEFFENERQSQIYLGLLEKGPLGAAQISNHTGLHRETIQRELKKMAANGVVKIDRSGRNKKTRAISVGELEEKISTNFQSFNLLLKPLLETQANKKIPQIQIYTGNHDFGLLQTRLIKIQPTGDDVRVISAQPKAWIDAMTESRKLDLFERLRMEKRANFKLCTFSQYKGQVEHNNREYFAHQPAKLKRQYRYLEADRSSPIQIQVWHSHALLSIFSQRPSVHILIEDNKIAAAMLSYFKILWNVAK